MRNEIAPFAINPGANVIAPGTWQQDPSRLLGFVSGIALSEQFNTALRQALFVGSMIGEFTTRTIGEDVRDDGDILRFMNQFIEAINRVGNNISGPIRPYWIAVNSAKVSVTPSSPAKGDTYLIPAGATGEWNGLSNQLAQWTGRNWVYVNYPEASLVGVSDTGDIFIRTSTGWRSFFATLSEALAGTDLHTVISPATLRYVLDVRLPRTTDSSYPPPDADTKDGDNWKDSDLDCEFLRIVDGNQHIWLQNTL